MEKEVWQCFRVFVRSLHSPSDTKELNTSCVKVGTMLKSSFSYSMQQRFAQKLLFHDQNLLNSYGRGFHANALFSFYESVFTSPSFRPTLDVLQVIDRSIDVAFFQMIWNATDYDEIIIFDNQSLKVTSFEGHQSRLTTTNKPLLIRWVSSLDFERMAYDHDQKFLLIVPSVQSQIKTRLLQIITVLYENAKKFYLNTRFPLATKTFLFYNFYCGFLSQVDASFWNKTIETDLEQCKNIIHTYD